MTVYYVDGNNGNNNNNGRALTAAFATIARGAQAATSPGDIVYVLDKTGGYYEEIDITAQGTSANPITFQAYSGHTPYMDGGATGNSNDNLPAGNVTEEHVPTTGYYVNGDPIPEHIQQQYAGRGAKSQGLLDFIGAKYIVWDGIDVKRSGGRGIRMFNGAENITVKNVDITEPRSTAVLIYSDYVRCENVYVQDGMNFAPFRRAPSQVNSTGAFVIQNSNITLSGCTIDVNWGEHIYITALTSIVSNVLISDCTFFDSMGPLHVHGNIQNITIERCYFYRSATTPHFLNGEGINVVGLEPPYGTVVAPKNVTIRNCIFSNLCSTASGSINIAPNHGSPLMENYTIANNTIINAEGAAFKTWGTANVKNLKFLNNIIYQTGSNARTNVSFVNTAEVTADYNYWSSAPDNAFTSGANDVISATSPVVNYQHNPARGQHDANNFRLSSSSSAINAGTNLSANFSDDYFGNVRGATWDIGAHEYNGAAPTPAFITADFSASTRMGPVPLTITFSDQSKSSGPINKWLWDFGDGSSEEQNPTHTYRKTGQFTVKLQVNGPAGEDTAIKVDYVTVTSEEEPPPPPPPPGEKERVTTGQQALYDFSEGSGLVVIDRANAGAPLNLTIEEGGAVRWLEGGGLKLRAAARLKSNGAARKVIDACRQANAITVEAWIKPANVTQSGPARILSYFQ
jgi:PKD repeat protein